jgi:nucleotide-binding universal stress UspA family protein
MDETRLLTDDDVEASVAVAPPTSIVVGHDGSKGAAGALEVALQLASDLGAPVIVLRAWSLVTAPQPTSWTFGYAPSVDELAEAVRDALVSDVQRQVAEHSGVEVACTAYHAGPAASLIRASREARMLVVGARGLGGLRELVLGSVSDQCVRHAHCPVLVTRTYSD